MSLTGLFNSVLWIIGFDGVLGGVTGAVYSVVFSVLSTFVICTLDAIVGITNLGSK